MGIYVSVSRLPLGVAVDWLTARTRFQDIDIDRRELLEPRHYFSEPTPDEPPRVIALGRVNSASLDAMTGTYHGSPLKIKKVFCSTEWEDPRAWAALGARLVGWPKDKLPLRQGADLRPIRYTLPEEIKAICEVLAQMTLADMREQVEQVLAESASYEYESESDKYEAGYKGAEEWMREEVAVNLLPNLRQFYEAARAEGQIVIHDMR